MTSILIAMAVVLLTTAAILAVVLLGVAGRGRRLAPRLARTMTRAARHLNGDAQPPKRLVRLIEHGLSR